MVAVGSPSPPCFELSGRFGRTDERSGWNALQRYLPPFPDVRCCRTRARWLHLKCWPFPGRTCVWSHYRLPPSPAGCPRWAPFLSKWWSAPLRRSSTLHYCTWVTEHLREIGQEAKNQDLGRRVRSYSEHVFLLDWKWVAGNNALSVPSSFALPSSSSGGGSTPPACGHGQRGAVGTHTSPRAWWGGRVMAFFQPDSIKSNFSPLLQLPT